MPARKRETEAWWTDTEPTSAAGGHVEPVESSGVLFGAALDERSQDEESTDALFGGTRPEQEADPKEDEGRPDEDESLDQDHPERTEVIPSGTLRPALQPVEAPARVGRTAGRRGRPTARRVRRTLRHVDPLSMLKLSLFYYGCFLVLWLVFVAVVYGVLAAAGVFDRLEALGRGLVLWENVDITLWLVERWAFFVGFTLAVLASIVNVFLSFMYNLAADVVGGVEVTFVERDL